MKVIWLENPITANRIVESLSGSTSWSPKTIKTLLTRLVQKGAVGFDSKRREYRYYPLIEKAVFLKEESKSFLMRLFEGAMTPMLATLVESEDLTEEDIKELKRLLENV